MVSTPVLNGSNCPPSPSQYVKRKEILIMKSFFCIRPWSIPLNTVNKSFIYQQLQTTIFFFLSDKVYQNFEAFSDQSFVLRI